MAQAGDELPADEARLEGLFRRPVGAHDLPFAIDDDQRFGQCLEDAVCGLAGFGQLALLIPPMPHKLVKRKAQVGQSRRIDLGVLVMGRQAVDAAAQGREAGEMLPCDRRAQYQQNGGRCERGHLCQKSQKKEAAQDEQARRGHGRGGEQQAHGLSLGHGSASSSRDGFAASRLMHSTLA